MRKPELLKAPFGVHREPGEAAELPGDFDQTTVSVPLYMSIRIYIYVYTKVCI